MATRTEAEQLALLEGEGEASAALPAVRGPGRPPGARNRRTVEVARWLIAQHGDPLAAATRIAARDIAAPDGLANLARELGMERAQAAEFWLRAVNAVLPYLHQRQPQALLLNPGAPQGEAVPLIIDAEAADAS
jgi:hypothetical protein